MNGQIKTINLEKKYGFITSDEDRSDYFFHKDDLADPSQYFLHIEEGIRVRFNPTKTQKGLRANDVELI